MSEKSEFVVEVVRITKLDPHPNADTLSFARFTGKDGPVGYDVLVRTADWLVGDRAVYVPVDSVVPLEAPEFSFLKTARIRAIRLRGWYSEGLLVPARLDMTFGQDVAESLGITKHQTKVERDEVSAKTHQARTKQYPKVMPEYGLDPIKRYGHVLEPGEPVVITEKIHGMNARFVFTRGKFWVGSHHRIRGCSRHYLSEWLNRAWLRLRRAFGAPRRTSVLENMGDVWWDVAERFGLREVMRANPETVLYGELYGPGIQDLPYDAGPSKPYFRAFDVYDLKAKTFLPPAEFMRWCIRNNVPGVPVLYAGPYDAAQAAALAEGTSTLNENHIREGVVIKPATERTHPACGRVALKLVGQGYRLRKEEA